MPVKTDRVHAGNRNARLESLPCLGEIRASIGKLSRCAIAAVLMLLVSPFALAVACTTQSQMTEADRASLSQSAKSLAELVQAGNSAGLKAVTIPSVAERFDPIAAAVESASPLIERGTLTVEALYVLDSTDLKSAEEETQFFCGGANVHEVVFSIPNIPPGSYALAILHASGVDNPQSIAFILAKEAKGGPWKLAGAFLHPLSSAGHDGIWYWSQAREFVKKKQNWNAYFYYQTAAYLLTPVYFLSSPNLDKLLKEQAAIAPPGLPTGTQPMLVAASAGESFEVRDMHTDSSLGGLDLVMSYQAEDTSDPVASRSRNIDLMKAILAEHPELREGFHGLWAYANSPDRQPFANELPMSQIQ